MHSLLSELAKQYFYTYQTLKFLGANSKAFFQVVGLFVGNHHFVGYSGI